MKKIAFEEVVYVELTGEEIKVLGVISGMKPDEVTKTKVAEKVGKTYRAVDYTFIRLIEKGYLRKEEKGFKILKGV